MYRHEEIESPPIWAAFGDLMACLFGIFVLFFCWMVMTQVSLTEDLRQEQEQHAETEARLEELQSALAGPLQSGLITLRDGRIGIRGAVLFDVNSAELRGEGRRLLADLAEPLRTYLDGRSEAVMISGFTDDTPLRRGSAHADNWELSTERALTVTRTLIGAGLSPSAVFAAGFGAQHPVASNDDEEGRALNRRVEISPVPRPLLEEWTGG